MAKRQTAVEKMKAALADPSASPQRLRTLYNDVRHAAQKRSARMKKLGYETSMQEKLATGGYYRGGTAYSDTAIRYKAREIVIDMDKEGASLKGARKAWEKMAEKAKEQGFRSAKEIKLYWEAADVIKSNVETRQYYEFEKDYFQSEQFVMRDNARDIVTDLQKWVMDVRVGKVRAKPQKRWRAD